MHADLQRLFSLDGRRAVVAGASRGIGAAVARGLAQAGAATIGCGRSPASEWPGAFDYRCCDLADAAAFDALCADAAAATGRIDVLVFAAGVTLPAPPGDMQAVDAFERTLSLNLVAAYRTARCALPHMTRGGSIVFVTSIGAQLAFPDNPGYLAAKGGLRQLARGLALDLGPRGIRVNALAPGYIRTAMTAGSHADPAKHAARAARTLLGRWGEPDDLVGAAVFLAADASAYVTGHELLVDGGWSAKGL